MKEILCVCIGNNDRSPVMAAVLKMFLDQAGHNVRCYSAGIGESAAKGGGISPFVITAGKRIGLDLSAHTRRPIELFKLTGFDLIICASDEIAGHVIRKGADVEKVYNAQISNPWPCHFQEDYDPTFERILAAMYHVVTRYFSG